MRFARLALSFFCFFGVSISVHAQMPPNLENGFKHWGSYDSGSLDTVNNLNGNQMLHAPLLPNYPQRGGKLTMQSFLYQSSKSWQVSCTVALNNEVGCQWVLGRSGVNLRQSGGVTVQRTLHQFDSGTGTVTFRAYGYSIQDATGTAHQMIGSGPLDSTGESTKFDSVDTSGFHLEMSNPDSFGVMNTFTVTDRHGSQYVAGGWSGASDIGPSFCPQLPGNHLPAGRLAGGQVEPMVDDAPIGQEDCAQVAFLQQVTDRNGNRIIDAGSWPTDTLGRTFAFFNGGLTTTDYSGCVSSHTITLATTQSYVTPDGSTRQMKLCYGSIPISTAFNAQGILELTGYNSPQLVTVVLADGTKWTFDYDGYGQVTVIGLPTGGTVTYTWTTIAFPSCTFPDGGLSRAVASRTVTDNNGHSSIWHYFWGSVVSGVISNTVTDPQNNDTIHTFTALDGTSGCGFYETQTKSYQGTGGSRQLLQQVDTTYSSSIYSVETIWGVALGNVVPTSIQTTVYPSAKVSLIQKTYAPPVVAGGPISGDVATVKEYDWGQGTPGALLRETDTTYQWQVDSSYQAANMLDLPASVIVKDGSGNRVAETDYIYDEPAYLTTSTPAVTTQHAAPPNGVRGNQTTVSRWLNTTNSFISSHTNWYDTGEPYQQVDALGHTTTMSYDPAYVGAYVTQTCSPQTSSVTHCVSGTYDFNTGVLTSLTNENATTQASGNSPGDSSHTSNYSYDFLFRITSAQAPPDPTNSGMRAQESLSFSPPNTFPLSVTRTASVTTSLSDSATSFFDGLARAYKSQHVLPNGTATLDTTFDGLGHPVSVSNPYFTTADPTYGLTQNTYDALDRVTQTTKQDGSISMVRYNVAVSAPGECTETTDEANKQRRTCTDALGRLIEVDEPGGTKSAGAQATASIAVSGSFNSIWASAGPMHPAAAGTAMSSVTMADGSSHTFYFDTSYHLCHLYGSSSWSNQDLTAQTETGAALSGSPVSAVVVGSAVHVFYQGSNQHIYDMEWTGSVWQNLDLTTLAGAVAVAGGKMAALVGGPNSPQLYYQGTNQHLYLVYWAASTGVWANADLTSAVGQTTLLATNSAVSTGAYGSGLYAFYVGTNQHLITIYWNGSIWTTADLTSTTGGALAVSGSSVATSVPNVGATPLMTFYEGSNQHVYSIYWFTGNNSWQGLDFTAFTGATNVAAALTALSSDPAGPQAYYVGSNQHLYDINWSGSAWVNSDLTTLSGATVTPASGSALSAHGASGGNPHHVFFTGSDQHIYDTFFKTSTNAWSNADLFTVAGNFVIDSGTVSLSIPTGNSSFTATVCYGASTNPFCAGKPVNASAADIANALAGVLNGTGSPVNASVSGTTLNLTWQTAGYNSAAVPSMTSTPDNPSLFPAGSFSSTSGAFSGGQDAGSQLLTSPMVTLYTYDALGNLTCVEQHGDAATGTGCSAAPSNDATSPWRVRRFSYDSLSRLLTAKNPESGMISYIYDNDGELLQKTSPAPNQTNPAVTQTVSYCYDALHRVTGRGYGAQSCPLASPVVTYTYDSGTSARGKLTSMTDQAGTASYGYDVLGRLVTETRSLTGAGGSAISKNISYTYNLDGSVKTLTYPSGNVVTYVPDSAGRTVSAVDGSSGINYVTNATYGPDSALTGFVSGNSATFAGITNAFSYNKRLQPVDMSVTAPSQTVFSIGYDFHAGTRTDNGNVFGITNYKDTTRNQTFTYDSLNRLISAQNAGTDCNATVLGGNKKFWGNTYGYDAWGNLLNKTKIIAACAGENLSVTAGPDNRLGSGYLYDAAGNMTFNATPPTQTYTYDEENRITGTAGYTYTYDGDGNRVRKSNGNLAANGRLYWYMTPGGVAETDLAGTLTSEYVFFDGERVARRDGATGTGGVFYYFSDHLKTASVITDSAGVIKAESDYYPWGGELQFVNNDSNDYKFTGKKRDLETGLDYFGARYYSNALGRFVSADWSATPVPVPYANFGDPQSLNQYGYVRNLPTARFDADGHCPDICPTPLKNVQEIDQHNQGNIGALKGLANVGIAGENMFLTLGKSSTGPIPLFQPSNESQAAGMLVGGAIGMAASVLAPEVGGGQTLAKGEQIAASVEKGGGAAVPKAPQPAPTGGLKVTEQMSKTAFQKLVNNISKNGLKDNTIKYVKIGDNNYIINGNNRFLAAQKLGITDQLNFQQTQLPFQGFKTAEDVINAHAEFLEGVRY
jgi:RHS repeat-associated protein